MALEIRPVCCILLGPFAPRLAGRVAVEEVQRQLEPSGDLMRQLHVFQKRGAFGVVEHCGMPVLLYLEPTG